MDHAPTNIPLDIPPDLLSSVDNVLQRTSAQPTRYLVHILLRDLAATGPYFVHVPPGVNDKNTAYNREANVTYTLLEASPGVILHDGTKLVFPTELDVSDSSGESSSPDYDSDGNKISDQHSEDDWDYEQVNPDKPWLGQDSD